MIIVLIVLALIIVLAMVLGINWTFHLCLTTAMYLFYLYLWVEFFSYDGKAGWKGFDLFIMTLCTAPFYFLYHLATFFISRSSKNKKAITISIVGLVLCTLHVCTVLSGL